MKLTGWMMTAAAILCAAPAIAQNFGGPSALGTNGERPPRAAGRPADRPLPAPLVPQADPWPRLDAGAVLCRSAEDLARYNALREARLLGQAPPPGPIDCSVIQTATPITIVSRDGPARTEVKLTRGSDQTGWTDVYLPNRQPGQATP